MSGRGNRSGFAGTPEERFLAKISHAPDSGCVVWLASTNGQYGILGVGGRGVCAHRWAYEHFVGPVPPGLELDHLCRNQLCVNPLHLEPVTKKVNVLRGMSPQAINARKTQCVHGHLFDAQNTIHRRVGRQCRECKRASALRRSHRLSDIRRALPKNPDARKWVCCTRGHPMSGDNLFVDRSGKRYCLVCLNSRRALRSFRSRLKRNAA